MEHGGEPRHLGRLIKQINDAIAREVNNDMRPRDITLSQMHVLIELDHTPDNQLRLSQLRERLGVAQPTAWGLVSRLEQKGLAITLDDPQDARAKLVRMTQEGAQLCALSRAEMELREQRLISKLSPDQRINRAKGVLPFARNNFENDNH